MLFEEASSSGEVFHVTVALVFFCCHVFQGFIFSKNTSVEIQYGSVNLQDQACNSIGISVLHLTYILNTYNKNTE